MKQKTAQNTSRRPIQEPLWIPAFAEMTKKYQSPLSHGFPLFPQNAPRHSREGGNPLGITVILTGVLFLNQPNLPCLGPYAFPRGSVGTRNHAVMGSLHSRKTLPVIPAKAGIHRALQ